MDNERYDMIVKYKDTGIIPDNVTNASNFRRLCTKFELSSLTTFGRLYFRKSRMEPTYVLNSGKEGVPLDKLQLDVDYRVDKREIVELYCVVKQTDTEEILKKMHDGAGCGGRDKLRFVITPNRNQELCTQHYF